MSTVYVWDNEQVVTLAMFDYDSFHEAERNRRFTHKFIVDSSDIDPEHRYGYMQREYESAHWVHVPKEMFPKKFLTHLLLLGVS
jgi:hypothetical protein